MSQSSYITDLKIANPYGTLSLSDFDAHAHHWQQTILKHPFNHKLSLFLPFASGVIVEQHLKKSAGYYYRVEELPLDTLLQPDFFTQYLHSDTHQLLLHSINTHLDTDNVVVLDHRGMLVFSLLRESFLSFGIVGRQQTKADQVHRKHVVQVDTRDIHMKPGSKQYERLKWCLENSEQRSFTVVAAFVDKETGETQEIQWPEGIHAQKTEMGLNICELSGISIPTFSTLSESIPPPAKRLDEHWQSQALQCLEWLGLAYIKAKRIYTGDRPQTFVSVYKEPAPAETAQKGVLVSWEGLVPAPFIQSMLITLRKMMLNEVLEKWASLSVWGYRDSPFTWQDKQHYYSTNGENDYTFLLLPGTSNEQINVLSFLMYGTHHVTK